MSNSNVNTRAIMFLVLLFCFFSNGTGQIPEGVILVPTTDTVFKLQNVFSFNDVRGCAEIRSSELTSNSGNFIVSKPCAVQCAQRLKF